MTNIIGKTTLTSEPLAVMEDAAISALREKAVQAFSNAEKFVQKKEFINAYQECLHVLEYSEEPTEVRLKALTMIVSFNMQIKKYNIAEEYANACLESFPDNLQSFIHYAWIYFKRNNDTCTEEVLHWLDLAYKADPMKLYSSMEKIYAIARIPKSCIEKATDASSLQIGDIFPKFILPSIKSLPDREAIKVHGEILNSQYHSIQGEGFAFMLGFYPRIPWDFKVLIKSDLALRYVNVFLLDKALEELKFVLNEKPDDSDALKVEYKLAIAYFLKGEFKNAQNHAQHVYDKFNTTEVGVFLGLVYGVQGNYDTTIALYNFLLEQYPADLQLYNTVGKNLYNLGEAKEAQRVFTEGLEAYKSFEVVDDNQLTIRLSLLYNLAAVKTINGEPNNNGEYELIQRVISSDTSLYDLIISDFDFNQPLNNDLLEELVVVAADTIGFVWEG